MHLHSDFTKPVTVHAAQLPWQDSPIVGVQRRMLDRVGDEVARATSIVRYAPGSEFSPHVHTGGEEFLVLDGVFQDEHGDFPAGSYVRNPPTSSHTPGSAQGCTIFVKLWQFDPLDRNDSRQRVQDSDLHAVADRPGVRAVNLHEDDRELVRIEQWQPGVAIDVDAQGGAEVLVLEGACVYAGERLDMHSWTRIPMGVQARFKAATEGARVWVKTGHLRDVLGPEGAM